MIDKKIKLSALPRSPALCTPGLLGVGTSGQALAGERYRDGGCYSLKYIRYLVTYPGIQAPVAICD